MSNIKFMRGAAANLPNTGTDGVFYLTTDTQRLYVGIGTGKAPIELNKSIRSIASLTALTALRATDGVAVGDFYYVASGATSTSGNILAYCSAVSAEGVPTWVQINPDTNTTITTVSSAATATTNGATITTSVSDSASQTKSGSVDIIGSSNITVAVEDGKVKISTPDGSDTTYTIGSGAATGLSTGETGAKILLSDSDNSTTTGDSEVVIKSANSKIGITQADDVITLTAADQGVNSVATAFDTNGGFTITVSDKNNNSPSSTAITPKINYGKSTSGVENNSGAAAFASGTATLDVYTSTEVDSKIASAKATIDAMTYKGTVSSSDASTKLASTGNVGDTYKASSAISSPVVAKTGDLIIAKGTDGSVSWDVVPSGDDQTITFNVNATTGTAYSTDGTNSAGYKVGNASSDDSITVAYTNSNGVITAAVKQKDTYNTINLAGSDDITQTAKTDASFSAITDITVDKYGNVSGAEKHTFTVKDTHANINSVSDAVAVANNVATITTTVADTDSATKSDSFTVSSSNLAISTVDNSKDVAINFVWEDFPTA